MSEGLTVGDAALTSEPRVPAVPEQLTWAARWAWLVVLIGGSIAVVAYFWAPGQGARELAYLSIGSASTACVLIGIRLHRPTNHLAWKLLGAGNMCFVLGDAVFAVYEFFLHQEPPVPSSADALYLLGYPFIIAGIISLGRGRKRIGLREKTADAAIVSIAVLAVSWRLLMASYIEDASLDWLGRLITMAYPIMDVGIIFIIMGFLVYGSRGATTYRLIALAMVAMLIADFGFDLLVLRGTYANGNLVDAGWLINYVLIGVAALHPAMAAAPPPERAAASSRSWVPTVVVAGFTTPAIMLVGALSNTPDPDVPFFAVVSAVLFALIVVRGSWLLRRVGVQNAELEVRTTLLQESLLAREALEGDLRHQAFHDRLTGLPNRNQLYDCVEQALASSMRTGNSVAICVCDLDRFKLVNDGVGHVVADQVLIIVAKRLLSVMRPDDTVARLNGDEFAMLLEEVTHPGVPAVTAERVLAVLREPIHVGDSVIHVTASIGIAFNDPRVASTPAAILADADTAMHEAKAAGRNRYETFEHAMRTRITQRLEMTNAFPTALQTEQFFLEYQPDYVLRSGRLNGFEALVRWNHPTLGRINPDDFIPLAEETGFIIPLGQWVLERACATAMTWSAQGEHPLTIAVNLSVRQLQDPDLVDDVRSVLSVSGLPARRLVLEVTESALMTDPASATTRLAALRGLGVRIAIDDFGTGHSSLSYLRQFTVDILKIDKSFVDPLANPASEGTAFVTTILRLARDLRLTTIAEGVEHASQRTALTELGCHQAQGYLLSRPLPASGARALIEAGGLLPPAPGEAGQPRADGAARQPRSTRPTPAKPRRHQPANLGRAHVE